MSIHKTAILTSAASLFALMTVGGCVAAPSHVQGATAITEVFGEGQKVIAVALKYDKDIDGSKLSTEGFKVDGRTITGVYTSASADPWDRSARGPYVIVTLSREDPAAALKDQGGMFGPRPGGPQDGPPPQGPGGEGPPPQGNNGPALFGPPPMMPEIKYKPAQVRVTTTGELTTADGETIAPGQAPIETNAVKNLVVDDFRQMVFSDPKTGGILAYNLFVPKDYDPAKTYPMVLFMPDATVTGKEPLNTLRQGNGATIWASPAEQAKHPAFVLAPIFSSAPVNDQSQATSDLDTVADLIHSLSGQYSLDQNRLYTTGQSGGAMMSIALDIKYPDLFAASYIVAGQWDASLVGPMVNDKLWIVVSQGDLKAYPGENAITAALEGKGAKVARAVWDGTSTPEQFDAQVKAVEAQNASINYVALQKGTVVPPGQPDNGGSNHINTWRIAYTIEGVRDWIFAQHK